MGTFPKSLHTSSRRTPGPITTGRRGDERRLPECPIETTRRMGPGLRRDDEVDCTRAPQTPPSSPGSTGRSSTPRLLGSTAGFPAYWIPAFAGMTSCGMGPGLHRDVEVDCTRAPQTPPSSPGSTGRSSTPRLLGSTAGFPAYWIPAFAGMTSCGMGPGLRRDDEVDCTRAPQTPPSSPGSTGRSSTPRLLGSTAGFPAYWIPAFAGMTACVLGNC